ncbi:MAG: hypothetical protein R3A44_06270 [Caldilineaceae bacterium]
MNITNQQILQQLPQPGENQDFTLVKVEDIVVPHPYCITPKHLEYADSMYLDEAAIERAEQRGAMCDICRKLVRKGKQLDILSHNQHEQLKTLFIAVVDNRSLHRVKGLEAYLAKIKTIAESLGIQGFAFPAQGQL